MEYLLRFIYDYPTMVNEEHSHHIMEPISPEEIKFEVFHMKKDKSPQLDGWPIKFFIGFMELFKLDLLTVMEEFRRERKVIATFNATFIALIPKVDFPINWGQYRPISLCICVYNLNAGIISS